MQCAGDNPNWLPAQFNVDMGSSNSMVSATAATSIRCASNPCPAPSPLLAQRTRAGDGKAEKASAGTDLMSDFSASSLSCGMRTQPPPQPVPQRRLMPQVHHADRGHVQTVIRQKMKVRTGFDGTRLAPIAEQTGALEITAGLGHWSRIMPAFSPTAGDVSTEFRTFGLQVAVAHSQAVTGSTTRSRIQEDVILSAAPAA